MATEEDVFIEELKGGLEDLQKRITKCEDRLATVDKLFRDAHIT
jgi:hypothetical protein